MLGNDDRAFGQFAQCAGVAKPKNGRAIENDNIKLALDAFYQLTHPTRLEQPKDAVSVFAARYD